jgi:thymidylate synthase (FAD)
MIRAISITKPLIEGISTAEELIVHNARVSNPNNQLNVETGAKLLKYCIKNAHWSIFEQVDLTLEIKTSRAIAAQILRHNSFRFQEFSQRYSVATEKEPIEWRLQGKTNRQVGDQSIELPLDLAEMVESLQDSSFEIYEKLVDFGVAKESARFVLPLNTSTTLYMKGSVRSWIHYFLVRCLEHTQKEHRDIALEAREVFKTFFPVTSEALDF